MNLKDLKLELKKLEDPEKAKLLQRFFKTGKGEYGEGDVFLGLVMPIQRNIAKQFSSLTLDEIQVLLNSKIHEERMIALLILIQKFNKNESEREEIFNFYLRNSNNINNWDLVDLSSPHIIGNFLLNKDRKILYSLAKSSLLWEKRIAILSTFSFIRHDDFQDAINISKILLKDKHDLIHKAVGWMLREIGKRDSNLLEKFIKDNYQEMPRTMLRYSIEKFPASKRKAYLKGEFNIR